MSHVPSWEKSDAAYIHPVHMSHVSHTWINYVSTYKWVMSHESMVSWHMNELRHGLMRHDSFVVTTYVSTYKWVMSHESMSYHDTWMNYVSTYKWVMSYMSHVSHTWMNYVSTHKWVMSYHINEATPHTYTQYIRVILHVEEWVMSHI